MWTLQHNLTADLTKHRRYYRDLLNNKTLGGFYILPRWRFLQCLCRIGFKPFVFSGEIDTTLWEAGANGVELGCFGVMPWSLWKLGCC